MFKPWLSKSVKDTRRSTERDYPPKRKKPWLAGSFPEMEHFHEGTYRPMGYPVVPPRVDKCAGRVLRPDQQITWESGGDLPKEFQTSVSGAVGNVTYSMDPSWSEVNENGDVATIDEDGVISLEENVCQGPYPPWIIYWVCDDCGCSSGTIWLEDSSADCDPCPNCDCEDTGADCYAECCGWTEDGTPDEIGNNDTKQYGCSGGGEWGVTGVGLSIDQTGLVTSVSACGTGVITNSVCGSREVRVQGGGSGWSAPVITCSSPSPSCGSCCTDPSCPTGDGCPDCSNIIIDGFAGSKYRTVKGCNPGSCSCPSPLGYTVATVYKQSWVCPP